MKKIALLLSAVFTILMLTPAAAASTSSQIKVDDIPIEQVQALWESLKNEAITVDTNGHLIINDYYEEFLLQPGYATLAESINIWNDAVDHDILHIDAATFELSNTDSIEELPEEVSVKLRSYDDTNLAIVSEERIYNQREYVTPPVDLGGCSYPKLDLLSMCEQNYQTIVKFYNSMLLAMQLNPNAAIDPATSTIAYWVGFVKEGGAWDYKRPNNLGPYDKMYCSYYNNTYNHITAEQIGNFNYGYTGSFLFPLSILHAGSYLISGLDENDKYDDWPVIDDGYYAKTGRS